MKTSLMLVGLAAVFAIGVACSGFASKSSDAAGSTACAGLEGQAKADCEKRQPQP